VDDDAPARELLASYLDSEYRIITAASGTEAIDKAIEFRPSAITLDVLMPKRSGFETLVALRRNPQTAEIPVILVSIVDQKNVGFALGASDYLVKPIHRAQILEAVRKHVSPPTEQSTLLVVDDDLKTRELVQETLHSAGYSVQGVQSGSDALEILSSSAVAGVVLDLLMPGMDGFQVLEHIRQQELLKQLPVIVMTAKQLTKPESDLLSRNTQALFHKSDAWPEQLVSEIDRVIGSRARARGAAIP